MLYRAVYNDCVKLKDFLPHNSVVSRTYLYSIFWQLLIEVVGEQSRTATSK